MKVIWQICTRERSIAQTILTLKAILSTQIRFTSADGAKFQNSLQGRILPLENFTLRLDLIRFRLIWQFAFSLQIAPLRERRAFHETTPVDEELMTHSPIFFTTLKNLAYCFHQVKRKLNRQRVRWRATLKLTRLITSSIPYKSFVGRVKNGRRTWI